MSDLGPLGPLVSSSEVENEYFMSGKLLFLTSRDEINGIFMTIFLLYIFNFKHDRLFALYDVIHTSTLHHIKDDVA